MSQKLSQPLKFQWGTGGTDQPPAIIHGFDVTLLIDLCRSIVQAESEGKIGERHTRVIAQGVPISNLTLSVDKQTSKNYLTKGRKFILTIVDTPN